MTKHKENPKIELSPESIKKVLETIGGDGHSIHKPELYLDAGMPAEFVGAHTVKYKSERSNYKRTIFTDGKPVNELTGVYALDMLYAIAANIGADEREAHSKIGRGFQAGALTEAIYRKLG